MKARIFISLILLAVVFISFQCTIDKSVTHPEDDFITNLKAIVSYDSTSIYVEANDQIIKQLTMPGSQYLRRVFYDRMTGLISYNQCKTTQRDGWYEAWDYELKVWDYKSDQIWSVESDDSFMGEGLREPFICNFSPETNSGIIIGEGWEWTSLILLQNGEQKYVSFVRSDHKILFAIIDSTRLLVLTYADTAFNYRYFIYNILTDQAEEIDFEQVLTFDELIMRQFGKNIHLFSNSISNTIYYSNTDWKADGSVFLYHRFDRETQSYDYRLSDESLQNEEILDIDRLGVIPIWRE